MMKRIAIMIVLGIVIWQTGCGALYLDRTQFPNVGIGGDGQGISYDEIQDILNDSSLSTDEKREELQKLGIEDEKLLDTLL